MSLAFVPPVDEASFVKPVFGPRRNVFFRRSVLLQKGLRNRVLPLPSPIAPRLNRLWGISGRLSTFLLNPSVLLLPSLQFPLSILGPSRKLLLYLCYLVLTVRPPPLSFLHLLSLPHLSVLLLLTIPTLPSYWRSIGSLNN